MVFIRKIICLLLFSFSLLSLAGEHMSQTTEDRLRGAVAYIMDEGGSVSTGTYCVYEGQYFILTCAHGGVTSQINSGDLRLERIVFPENNIVLGPENVERVIYASTKNYLTHATDHAKIILRRPIEGVTPFRIRLREAGPANEVLQGVMYGYGARVRDLKISTLANGRRVAEYEVISHHPSPIRLACAGSEYGSHPELQRLNLRIFPTVKSFSCTPALQNYHL